MLVMVLLQIGQRNDVFEYSDKHLLWMLWPQRITTTVSGDVNM